VKLPKAAREIESNLGVQNARGHIQQEICTGHRSHRGIANARPYNHFP
jgi:hypothetical protein